jgi:hypothetical protein
MTRKLIILAIVIAAVGLALPYAPVDFLKAPLEHALERGLGRKVDVDNVSLTLFSGPGFSLDGVTIHEDPRAGIEPFVYASTLDARLDPLALLRGRLEFSSLNLNDATFNLVKPDDAPWNFQLLFNQAPSIRLPALKMRGGRVNFKFGQSKSILFFDDTDLDISPDAAGALDLRFSGAPARTDRSAQSFGHFFVRGTAAPSRAGQQLNLRIELEPSSLDAVAHLFTQSGVDLKGIISLDAQVSGEPSRLDVNGTVRLEGSSQWQLGYKGTLNLTGQTLDLVTLNREANPSMKLEVSARNLLSRPEWDLAAELEDAPLASAIDAVRRLGAPLPEQLAASGTITGSVRYSNTGGLGGNVELRDAVLALPDATPIRTSTATVFLKGQTIAAGPVTVTLGDAKESAPKTSAEVQATYQSGEGGGLEVTVTTRRMNVADLRAYGFAAAPLSVPMLDRATGGTWRGSLKYARPSEDTAEGYARPAASPSMWAGDFEVQDTQLAVDGLADPVRLLSAVVSVKPEQVSVTRIRAETGDVSFSGDYRWSADPAVPAAFHLRVENTDAKEIERLFLPTVSREAGVFARTLGLGSNDSVPAWLAKRKAEGTLAVKAITIADTQVSGAARIAWNGASVAISGITAKLSEATLGGDLLVDLSGRAPSYTFTGKLGDLAYKGGKLDLSGTLEAAGNDLQLLRSIKARGTVRGRSLALSPDAEYRRAAGRFDLSMTAAGPLWKLSGLELSQGSDTYAGDGVVEADGKLALDIHRN